MEEDENLEYDRAPKQKGTQLQLIIQTKVGYLKYSWFSKLKLII